MRRKTNFSINPKFLLIGLAAICFILIFVSFKYTEKIEPVKTAMGDMISPMQKGINEIGRFFSDKVDMFQSMEKLRKKNQELQSQLDTISYENKILQQEKYELTNLRELYNLDSKYPSYPKVAARVIDKDPGNWYNVFTIDKGSNDGLKVDMNVIAGNGLVGIIIEVGHNYAKVRSIIDDSSNVSGMFLKTSETCIVKGNLELINEGLLEVGYIENNTSKIEDGSEVVTSHLGDKYLQGILIGYIKDITTDSTKMTKSGYLTPAVDFNRLENVLVITQLKEKLY